METNNKKILLGVNSKTVELLIIPQLKNLSVEVSIARSGLEILDSVRNQKPDLLILQALMKGVPGLEICHQFSSNPDTASMPIILFSASDEIRRDAKTAGARGFLKFPFVVEELTQLVRRCLSNQKTILVVDDSKTIHTMLGLPLEAEGYKVEHAMDGNEGLALVNSNRPDLIISDLEMPIMDGYTFCSHLKKDPSHADIPVIISSSLGSGFHIDKGFDCGADDYLTKPVVIEELLSRISALLDTTMRGLRETILIVNDNKVIQNTIVQTLTSQGFRAVTADSCESAIKVTTNQNPPPALFIIDGDIEGTLTGRELVRELRKNTDFTTTPIILLTSRDSKVDRAKGQNAGVSEFLSKPFTNDKLLVNVERLLSEARLRRERDAMKCYISETALDHVVQVAKDVGMGGAKMSAVERDMTVLFTDIAGFTPLCEGRSPQEIVTLLNEYYDLMVAELKKNDAAIDKFIGDAIMALFVGKDKANNALRAVKAGLAMLDKLAEFNQSKTNPKDQIHIRVGINSGQVIMGDLGSRLHRRDFTVIGDNVNTAQRIEGKAPKDGVLISDATYQLIKEHVVVETTEPLVLKGKAIKLICHIVKEVKS